MPKSPTGSVKRKAPKRKAPWKKPAPKGTRHTHLSPSQKAKARRSAKRAGRSYPNLVDNMRAAGAKRSSGSRKKKASSAKASKKRTSQRTTTRAISRRKSS